MLDRDSGVHFDQDPNLNRPLRAETRDCMQRFRNSREFDSFLLNQLIHGRSDRKAAEWGSRFVDRITGTSTPAEADAILLPWVNWSNIYTQLSSEYSRTGGGQSSYDGMQRKFAEAGISPELREQMGDMSADNFRFNAEFYLFRFTGAMKGVIDMMEQLPRAVLAETVFRVQRIMRQPLYPEGGLIPEEGSKPRIRRIETQEDFDERPEDEEQGIIPLGSTDCAWGVWNRVEVDSRVTIVPTGDHEIDAGDWGWKPGESGTVYGYSPMGAGDRMLFQPAVDHIALLVRDVKTYFLKSALIRQIQLVSDPLSLPNGR